ncbi:hypothetical protein RB195_016282 [Necator americanus]|uniref:Uncharacterized protein n=1 Tax=Necator americanus TaxID=51031 RepID=A0ABR1E8E0_NECAM
MRSEFKGQTFRLLLNFSTTTLDHLLVLSSHLDLAVLNAFSGNCGTRKNSCTSSQIMSNQWHWRKRGC